MRLWVWLTLCLAMMGMVAFAGGPAHAQKRGVPYYASIDTSKARMRTGPGRNYPASWLYERAGLPIKVIDIYKDWRKIEDPDGTQGWMHVSQLNAQRTAMVTGGIAAMRDHPEFSAGIAYRAAPGVIGKISDCHSGWCWFDVKGQAGYVEQSHLWGVDPGEEF